MIPVLKLIPCLLVGALIIAIHEHMAQTWAPMFRLILITLGLSSILAWCFFRRASIAITSCSQTQWSCVGVFIFFTSWILLWAVAEEGLIAWTLSEYGPDDTGGRYFYPGHSGMGYADGLSSPLNLFWKTLTLALPAAWLLGTPIAMIGRKEKPATP